MSLHSGLTISDGIHIPYAWTYASSTSREAATGMVSGDIGKFARQLDDNSIWMLVATTPTWVQVSSGGSTTPTQLILIAQKSTSGTIAKGAPVYIAGYDGTEEHVEVEEAKADAAATMPCVGIANDTITDSGEHEIVVYGKVSDIATNVYSANDPLYVSASAAGTLTDTKPTGATDLIQKVGTVLYSHATEGIILVIGAGRTNDMPNLTTGKIWQGDGSNHAAEVTPLALSATVPVNVTKAAAAAGSATEASRQDHKHDITTAVPVDIGTANAEGSSASLARADHVHNRTFGSHPQNAASEAESDTSSTSWVQKLRLTTPSIPAGTYRVGWNYEWQYESAANDALVQVEVDDTTVMMEMRQEPADAGTDQWNNKCGFGYVTLTAAAHTIDLDYQSANGLYSTHIRRARLELWRVS
jgi:hypothetical protein